MTGEKREFPKPEVTTLKEAVNRKTTEFLIFIILRAYTQKKNKKGIKASTLKKELFLKAEKIKKEDNDFYIVWPGVVSALPSLESTLIFWKKYGIIKAKSRKNREVLVVTKKGLVFFPKLVQNGIRPVARKLFC